eukprot:5330077-Heterocapsa_arctica.AAC.1
MLRGLRLLGERPADRAGRGRGPRTRGAPTCPALHAAFEAQDQVQRGLLLDVVERERAAVL